VVAADGVEHPVDAIIFGTGFQVTDMPIAHRVRGAGGRTLAEHWGPSMRAHRGCTVPGFPNLFMLLGPNTGLGHGSMVYMIESQIQYVLDALRAMRADDVETAEVQPFAIEQYNEELGKKLEGTVWNTGCSSWYLDDTGRNATQFPDFTWRFRQRTARFDPSHYLLEPRRDTHAEPAEREAVPA
jgi:hypothetical protein